MDDSHKDDTTDIDSLENTTTVVEPTGGDKPAQAPAVANPGVTASPAFGRTFLRSLITRFNIYFLLFVLLVVVAAILGAVFYFKAQTNNGGGNLASQSLSQNTLDQLANSDVSVGEPQHTLNVQSNAVFAGNVLVRSNLQIAGTLQVGTDLAINGIRVTGNSTFDDVQITKSLAVTGNGSFQGQLNVQSALNVNGAGTFLGAVSAPALTVGTLQLNGDLNLTHHLAAGGSVPSRSNGNALGVGGTTSFNGSDTAGSVTINTGSSPNAGCFITINFANQFNSTPHIVITPVGAAAAGLAYYITRTTSNFSICTTSTPPSSTTFGYDYIAFD